MRRIGGAVVIRLVAVPARPTGQGVIVVQVTGGAGSGGVQTNEGEAGRRMIERGSAPVGGGVALRAVLREVGRLVRRIVGVVVVRLVAVPAGAAREAVVVVHVALVALQGQMRPRQGEARGGVVERGIRPSGRGASVAEGAILREAGGHVRRIRCAVVIGLMTVPTGRAGQRVIVVDMALCALNRGVHADQGEPGGRVIECGVGPIRRRTAVAESAILREIGRRMGRIGGAVIVGW